MIWALRIVLAGSLALVGAQARAGQAEDRAALAALQLDDARLQSIGWRLATWAWGKGYATEGARAALAVGLEQVDQVVSFTASTNLRSQAVMRRLGMRPDGEFDHPRIPEGHPLRRHVLYRIP